MRKMAVNNDMDLYLQIPEKSDVLLFVEDLVDHMQFLNGGSFYSKWKPAVFRNDSYNTSVPIIRRIINLISYSLEGNHDYLQIKMERANLINTNSYERFDKILVENYFRRGFNAKYFFLYCVNLSEMAVYFYDKGISDAPDLAKQYIYQFLQKYVSAVEWDTICRIAENYVKMLRDSLSDTEHQDQEEEEVRTDGSSSSPSEKVCVSENSRSNIKLQIKYACSNIKGYLILHASNGKSQVGLCSLREPESSSGDKSPTFIFEGNKVINRSKSDDKPSPGTSNIHQELIFDIGDFKLKTNMLWNRIKLIENSAS